MAKTRLALLTILAMGASVVMGAPGTDSPLTTPPPDKMPTNVVKVLRTSNKSQVNQYVCKVYDIKNCNPYEIINFPELLAEAEEGMIYTFIHPDGNKGKILVACPDYQIPYFDQLIPSLDRPKITSRPGSKYVLYRGKNRTPQWLSLQASYYGASQDVFYPDVETNSILMFGVPSGCDGAVEALNATDVPTPQAVIEVTIYDVKLNNDGTFGFDFHAWKNGPGRALFGVGTRYQALALHNVGYPDGSSHGQGFFMDYPSAYFDFLAERGKAKVLTSTKVAAMNNKMAQISTGETVLFYRVSQTGVLDRKVTGATQPRTVAEHVTPLARGAVAATAETLGVSTAAPPQLAIDPVRTGVSLELIPIISQELVDMDILAKVVTLVGYDDAGQPVLSSRQFSNRAQVASGKELVIGGLMRDRKVQTTRKIPILGSIPVLGWAFGGEITGAEKTMVVAVVKPTVEKFESPLRPEDKNTMAKAKGDTPIPMPPTPFGFDQWGFDRGQ
jgi:type II secretory pathway component GspD/PulD (secretin)